MARFIAGFIRMRQPTSKAVNRSLLPLQEIVSGNISVSHFQARWKPISVGLSLSLWLGISNARHGVFNVLKSGLHGLLLRCSREVGSPAIPVQVKARLGARG
jgi:hypothetical protein